MSDPTPPRLRSAGGGYPPAEGQTMPCLCDTSAGPAGCPLHHPAGVAEAATLAHRHRWVYDGQQLDGRLIYHCDDHDPPLVFVVTLWRNPETP
jgi:hypothetical protein